jgi:hypothetical protein
MKTSPTSDWCLGVAERMEEKLDENRHKGNRNGWLVCSPEELLERVEQELAELRGAIASGVAPDEVWREAADVANMAAMAADAYAHRYRRVPAPVETP